MWRFLLACLWFLFLLPIGLSAKPLVTQDVPDTLKPWVGWALYGNEQRACPFLYNNAEDHRCAWPSRLELSLDDHSGSFDSFWRVEAESWAALPGNAALWPQEVQLDGKPVVVVSRGQTPSVWLPPGAHRLTGRFIWDRLPENLAIPRDSGLISLAIKGKPATPVFNEQGDLWIQGAQAPMREEVANTLTVRVFRRIVDEIPLRVATRLDLEVAGEQREVLLAGGLLPDAIPLVLSSPLPARLETDGRLRVLTRAGRWQIELATRQPGQLNSLPLPEKTAEPWPPEEVWSFEAHHDIRVVEIEGAQAIDPRQTEMPEEWKNLPAYRLRPGDKLAFRTLRRGDPESSPDSLNLRRNLWLDFDGGGYTVHDDITGHISRNWRLDALPGLKPGRVDIDGAPQLLTLMDGSANAGVELRRGQVRLAADSRGEAGLSRLSATGWARDFQSVSAELNLPPGWRLFSATGVDNAPQTWVARWTLLDLFLVLIAALAIARLRGWPGGAVAAAALILLWHEPDAPRMIWLHLLVAVVLLQVLPAGRFATAVKYYRNLAVLALAFIALPFMVEQVRLGIYPQLEIRGDWGDSELAAGAITKSQELNERALQDEAVPSAEPPMQNAPSAPAESESENLARSPAYGKGALDSLAYSRKPSKEDEKKSETSAGAATFSETDPEALTQTGPGLPRWRWKTLSLSWNGPVLSDQEVGLILLSPPINLLLNLLRVALIFGLAWVLLRNGGTAGKFRISFPGFKSLSLILFGVLFFPQAKADVPDQKLLAELQSRLLAPPECLPSCAEISLMRLHLGADGMTQRLEIHALAAIAVPLPAQEGQWLPVKASMDGLPAEALFRSADGALWLGLKPGRHEVLLAGPLPVREQVQLALPLRPHRVEVEGDDWKVEGVKENGEPEAQLQLTRLLESGHSQAAQELEARPLPPFLEVRRTLRLGLNWRVSNQVIRISPADAPVVLEVPLLEGESVTTPGLQVLNGKVAVSLAAGQSLMDWESVLEKSPSITLKAPQTPAWTEVWRADASPAWHLESEGIPVVHHQDSQSNRLPEWRPWPGESAILKLVRPKGAPGSTLTLESSRLQNSPGLRAADASLNLIVRSSQGGQHTIRLPEGAVLQSANVDGAIQPIRQQDQTVTLPIHPGAQNLTISWRQESGISPLYVSPKVDLGASSVNSHIGVNLGRDRWVLLTGGPNLGPAVLFWGVVAVLALVAFGLGKLDWTPLKPRHWFLLLIGLSQVELLAAACVVAWLFALGWRGRRGMDLDDSRFNATQLGLALLSPLALLSLFYAVQQGLLGLPDMQVAGNGSTASMLRWYQDRNANFLPQPWVLSAPLWSYRLLMLSWALWLAYSLLDWLRWGWERFTLGGLWRPRKPSTQPAQPKTGWQDEQQG